MKTTWQRGEQPKAHEEKSQGFKDQHWEEFYNEINDLGMNNGTCWCSGVSVPCNQRAAGSNLPQATAWQPWISCSHIILLGTSCPTGQSSRPVTRRAMFPLIFLKSVRTKFPVCNLLPALIYVQNDMHETRAKTFFKGKFMCAPSFLVCAHRTTCVRAQT